MQLRSGRVVDEFTTTFAKIKGSWPTLEEVCPLVIETEDVSKFEQHLRWLVSHGVPDKKANENRLVTLAASESFLKSSLEVQFTFKKMLQAIYVKLSSVDHVVVEFDLLQYLARLNQIV